MFWWEQMRDQHLRGQRRQEAVELSLFTPEQIANLCALRDYVHTRRAGTELDIAELDIDECHLQFARWLVEHGRLGEWMPSVPSHPVTNNQETRDKYGRR